MKTQPLRVTLRETTSTALIDAAERVAARDGLTSANLQAIADQAGVAVGTIYNYFEDKEGLFEALFKRRREGLLAEIDAATKRHRADPFVGQLSAFIRAVFAYFDTHRDFLRIQFEDQRVHAVKGEDTKRGTAAQQLHARAAQIVRMGLREKRLGDSNAELLATILMSIIRGVLMARAESDEAFAPDAGRVASLFLHGAAK
jgi:AcrR family transcriptional regulator